MTILTLEENQILANDQAIADLPAFLERLPPQAEIALILKSHEALYHLCPLRKSVPFVKSAEYSADYWVGEKRLPKGQTFIGGVLPSPFMRTTATVIACYSFAVKGAFLWADLIMQAYGPFDAGWTLIWHNRHLLICQDGILRISRACYAPLLQELPAILRYLKRFGYQEETLITLFKSSLFPDPFPPFIHAEIRIPNALSFKGLKLQIPELAAHLRFYAWPRKIRATAYGMVFFSALGSAYFGWQIKLASQTHSSLKEQIRDLSEKEALDKAPLDEAKMEVFAAYRRLAKDRPDLLFLLRQLVPVMREKAVATYLHWTADPEILTLRLELCSSMQTDEMLFALRSQLPAYRLDWQEAEEEPLKGTLRIEKHIS